LNNKKVDCVLTLDYELFFGKSGTALNSLLKPTKYLLDVLDKINGKATFFVDTMYLMLLRDSKKPRHHFVYKQLEEQLINIICKGHRIELHLHPHWLDAYSNTEEWTFPSYEHYKLNSLSSEKIGELFKQGTDLLNDIAHNIDPGYSVVAFRAGGYCIKLFDVLKKHFIWNNIKIDSSVIPLMKIDGNVHKFDYSEITPVAYYFFSDNTREINTSGEFLEVSINWYDINRIERIINFTKIRIDRNAKIFGDGIGMTMTSRRSIINKIYFYLFQKQQYKLFPLMDI
jgi:hypothetical protein